MRRTMTTVAILSVVCASSACGGGSSSSQATSAINSISGTVSGPPTSGVYVALTGASTAGTTTDANGNYTFTGLLNGRYTVTPSVSGYDFTPASMSVTVNGADMPGQNFTAVASTIAEFPVPTSHGGPAGIAAGPDGNLWFTELEGNQLGRITPSGTITEFAIPTSHSGPVGIAAGPDGNLWFTETYGNKIGRLPP